ncbi:TonB-dependent receptor [Nitrincola sp. MINF-07-Sa-05]|uniref:TonB-dependent receptor n=1 Tax=Nitrincola salilacus TaxID=3400273 RepID=UPI00391809B8
MHQSGKLLPFLIALSTPSIAFVAMAQDATTSDYVLDTLVVGAERQNSQVDEQTKATTVIDREQLETQFQTARNLGEILSKTVPGMAPASQTLTNFNQTLRGRNMLVLIDGVPQNNSRNVSRDLMNIDVSNIERIEVMRGGSAVYGSGAAGGIVSITTRRNRAEAISRLGVQNSLSNLKGDSIGYRGEQSFGGGNDQFDYGLNLAWEHQGASYDGRGDCIAPEPSQGDLSDSDSLSIAGKLSWYLDEGTLTLSANHFDAQQDTDYASDPAVNQLAPGDIRARAINGLQLDDQNRNRNSFVNLSWQADDTPLGMLDAQVYYRDYHARFTPFDARAFAAYQELVQTYLDSETLGSRLTINTELTDQALLRWGADLSREKSEMPVTTFDGNEFDASGGLVFINTGDRLFMPPITQENAGIFVQLEYDFTDRLRAEVGSRYEYASASFNDFTTLGQRNAIEGGKVSFDDFLFNAGLVYQLNDTLNVYGSFAQGFELPDLGLQLRIAPAGFDITDSQLNPIKTDSYEMGIRGDWDHTQASVALFYNTSDLGQVLIQDFSFAQRRAKERIYGVEATLDHYLDDQWKLGGLITWMAGENYNESAQSWKALNSYRIPPLQLRAHVEYSPNSDWLHRLQVNHSGSRDDAFKDQVGFGSRKVTRYTTLDYNARYQSGQHSFDLGIENLLDKDYHHVYGQLLRDGRNTSHIPASGATLKLGYQYRW